MVEEINIKYTRKDNNWFCNTCNGEIYSGKKKYNSICSCSDKKYQYDIYIAHLNNYYIINGNHYLCKKCNVNIKNKRERHALICRGVGTLKYISKQPLESTYFSKTCDMGCGNDSKFFYKSGKAYCCKLGAKCPIKVEKDRAKKIGINPFEGKDRIHPKGFLGKTPHNKGKTKETSEIVMKQVIAQKKAFAENGHN